ncbi:MAG: extracellular solute-binding protein [Thermoanaerobacterales bacterium]|jgi:iron(III) transport system substrate-binding protein|nr:extracellular solute-binding protein [Thermoanaerobacterales bacterium]
MRTHARGFWGAAAAAVVLLPLMAGCGNDDDGDDGGAGADEGGGTLTIYSGREEDLIGPLFEDFSEETGIEVEVRYGDSADLALLIDEEGDNSPADVFISQSPGAVGFLAEQGRLAEIDESVLEQVAEGDAAEDGTWVGLSGRVRTLVYNTDLVDPATLPDSVLDLTDEQYAGQVALAPTNASFQDFVTVLRVQLGEDEAQAWLDGMAAGDPPTFDGNTAIVEAVGRGEVPMGLVNHYYAARALAEDPDLPVANHFFPEGDYGSTLLVTAGAIIEGTDDADAAAQLLDFLLSEEAQTYFSQETFEYPLASGVEPPEGVPPFDEVPKTRVDLSELGGGLAATTEMIDASGLTR